ncbi:MAG: hypothetical protein QOD77_1883 [Thermoplasmata archaeon]|jgi:hypothetical protein|nr:hypothetical protein [Thermoplasmata archaeon]
MPAIDAEVLALVESAPGMAPDVVSEVRHYVEVGEHGIALAHLVDWVVRNRADAEMAARLARLVKVSGFAEDLQRLRDYEAELPGTRRSRT